MKVAVTGAAGQIGYSLVFRIASGEMFGPGTAVSLRLIETPQALSAVRGVMMELQDCAFPLLKAVSATDDALAGFEGADWALLIGSVPRTAGMERGDLLKINGGIFIEQGKALDAGAGDGCRVLVVGNPCNTNAWIAKSVCRRIPSSRFFAMTLLDQNRAAAQLALKAGAGVEDVSRLAVWGNHSATQYPDFYNARIHGKPVLESIPDEAWLRTEFLDMVQKRGAAVIAARGKSSAASAANAVIGTVKNLESATPDGAFVSVAVSSDGSYGIEEGLMYSFPVRSDGERWQVVQGLPVNDFSRQKLDASADELRMETDAFENMFS